MIVNEEVQYNFIESDDKLSYFKHPTFTYRGNHENFLIGLFGDADIDVKTVLNKPSIKNSYTAFAMKFKLPGEHRFESVTYNGEIHVHMTNKNEGNFKDNMKKMFNLKKSLPYK